MGRKRHLTNNQREEYRRLKAKLDGILRRQARLRKESGSNWFIVDEQEQIAIRIAMLGIKQRRD